MFIEIDELAKINGFSKLNPPDGWLSYIGPGPVQIDINLLTRYIITKLFHPKRKAPTKLGRKMKNLSDFFLLRQIFENPRAHTGLGEYLEWAAGEKEQFHHDIRIR